ncbi:MAG: hypothetical protein MZV70_76790 [Desulfobacterales bacterium]|nr:hypothetical protein [Desulfobacterales bacterium]
MVKFLKDQCPNADVLQMGTTKSYNMENYSVESDPLLNGLRDVAFHASKGDMEDVKGVNLSIAMPMDIQDLAEYTGLPLKRIICINIKTK